MNKQGAIEAVSNLLKALDQDMTREGLVHTPRRVVESLIEQCSENDAELDVTFSQLTYDGMVMVRDVPFVSYCEHHLLPYSGRVHIAYIPRKRVLGISKLARLAYSCSRGFTIQETVTETIADRLYKEVEPLGCMIVVEAEHGCMNLRGARAIGSSTITSVVRGIFRDVTAARSEFLSLIDKGGPR